MSLQCNDEPFRIIVAVTLVVVMFQKVSLGTAVGHGRVCITCYVLCNSRYTKGSHRCDATQSERLYYSHLAHIHPSSHHGNLAPKGMHDHLQRRWVVVY